MPIFLQLQHQKISKQHLFTLKQDMRWMPLRKKHKIIDK